MVLEIAVKEFLRQCQQGPVDIVAGLVRGFIMGAMINIHKRLISILAMIKYHWFCQAHEYVPLKINCH